MPLEKSNNRDGRARKGSILNYEHWKSLMLKHTSLMLKHHARENAMMRYKEKKRARMLNSRVNNARGLWLCCGRCKNLR
uniref:Uncharacterized protein n=1 Tax=Populus trichocarpa TaxID=3694 RepID=B9HWC1_POPTR